MTPAPISVERLRELLVLATPGPWLCCDGPTGYQHRIYSDSAPEGICDAADTSDTRLIAAAVNALPALLHQLAERDAECERLREELDVANTSLGQATTDCVEQSFRAEAAERAREEACKIIAELRDYVVNERDAQVLPRKAASYQRELDSIDAFLAASGGDRG